MRFHFNSLLGYFRNLGRSRSQSSAARPRSQGSPTTDTSSFFASGSGSFDTSTGVITAAIGTSQSKAAKRKIPGDDVAGTPTASVGSPSRNPEGFNNAVLGPLGISVPESPEPPEKASDVVAPRAPGPRAAAPQTAASSPVQPTSVQGAPPQTSPSSTAFSRKQKAILSACIISAVVALLIATFFCPPVLGAIATAAGFSFSVFPTLLPIALCIGAGVISIAFLFASIVFYFVEKNNNVSDEEFSRLGKEYNRLLEECGGLLDRNNELQRQLDEYQATALTKACASSCQGSYMALLPLLKGSLGEAASLSCFESRSSGGALTNISPRDLSIASSANGVEVGRRSSILGFNLNVSLEKICGDAVQCHSQARLDLRRVHAVVVSGSGSSTEKEPVTAKEAFIIDGQHRFICGTFFAHYEQCTKEMELLKDFFYHYKSSMGMRSDDIPQFYKIVHNSDGRASTCTAWSIALQHFKEGSLVRTRAESHLRVLKVTLDLELNANNIATWKAKDLALMQLEVPQLRAEEFYQGDSIFFKEGLLNEFLEDFPLFRNSLFERTTDSAHETPSSPPILSFGSIFSLSVEGRAGVPEEIKTLHNKTFEYPGEQKISGPHSLGRAGAAHAARATFMRGGCMVQGLGSAFESAGAVGAATIEEREDPFADSTPRISGESVVSQTLAGSRRGSVTSLRGRSVNSTQDPVV